MLMNPSETNTIQPLLDAIRSGHRVLLHSGRPLWDVHASAEGNIESLRTSLLKSIKRDFGMAAVTFNLAMGGRFDWDAFADSERTAFERDLAETDGTLAAGITASADYTRPPYERAYFLLGAVHRSLVTGHAVPPMLVLIEFGEDLVPDQERGCAGETVIQISELLRLIAANRNRMQRTTVLISGVPERMDRRVLATLHQVCIPNPDKHEKEGFISALRSIEPYRRAVLEEGLDDRIVGNLTSRTPNLGTEEAYFESGTTGRAISYVRLVEKKRADVTAMSDGTLNLLDTDRVKGVELVGKTIERPLKLLESWADGIMRGNAMTPMNLILCGAPSTAKTDISLMIALRSKIPVYSILSPKGQFVGLTEMRVRLLFWTFKAMSPAVGIVDEITEAFPMDANGPNLDSGATKSVVAEMLNALSDTSRAGKTLIIATTNCPWKVSDVMASRFLFVPVLSALEEDYPEILCAIASRLVSTADWNPADPEVIAAALEFFRKGATPRVIRSLICARASSGDDPHDVKMLARAAKACATLDPRSRCSAEYADLYAIRKCSDLEMLPWHGRAGDYPWPAYLKPLVDQRTGEVDMGALDHRLNELKQIVNI